MSKVNLFVRNSGVEKLILQFITGEDIEIIKLKNLDEYEDGVILFGFECIDFGNVMKILLKGIRNIVIVKSQPSTFKWYNSFVLERYKAIITTPFGRRDFQRALKYVFSIERKKG